MNTARRAALTATLATTAALTLSGVAWGIGTPTDAPQPPVIAFEEVCIPPTATPAPTDTPMPTVTPTSERSRDPPGTVRQDKGERSEGPTPLLPTAALEPAPTDTPQPEPDPVPGTGWGSYAAFGGVAVLLVIVGVTVLRKR